MKKVLPWFVSAFALLAVGGGAYWAGRAQSPSAAPPNTSPGSQAAKAPASPPATMVEATKVVMKDVAQGITAVGSLRSDESVIVRPEVSGRIAAILFTEGQRVSKGAVLVRFDASVQRAELQQAEANLSLSKSKLERALDLQKRGFVSSQARDEAESNSRIAQAAYDLASARLSKLEIRAPFSGTMGLRSVSVGDYVRDGQDIANLEAIDPLKVDFRVPELFLKQVANGQSLQVTLDAFPSQVFQGRVFAINPLLDANGRSIVIRAVVKNADSRLRPGMFARVRLLTSNVQEGMIIPEQAVVPSGDEFFVFRVVDGRASRAKIEIGQRQAGVVEVVRGLNKDDMIVTAGQLKIRDGAAVNVASAPAEKATAPENAAAKPAPAPAIPNATPAKS
jgi:membrane fusion protein, multidrug efflux system